MRKAYIAGPMRGYKDFNFPAFDAAERRLRSQGWVEADIRGGQVIGLREVEGFSG